MAFEDLETSRALGAPITLYKFSTAAQVYGYTDADDVVAFEGDDYQPIPIDRDSVTTSGTLDKAALTIRVPHDVPIAELFRVFPPSEVVGLTIFQGHVGETEFLAIWVGRVLSCAREGSEASLSCEPVSTSMKRPMLRGRYQYQCRHALYGPKCRLIRSEHEVTATVVTASNGFVTFGDGWNGGFAEARFANGIIEWTGDDHALRQILSVDAALNRLKIGGSTASLEAGMTVKLNPGCNHKRSDCLLFGNSQNYGGCDWIPRRNPLGAANVFY